VNDSREGYGVHELTSAEAYPSGKGSLRPARWSPARGAPKGATMLATVKPAPKVSFHRWGIPERFESGYAHAYGQRRLGEEGS
jgi:hypothetical protein